MFWVSNVVDVGDEPMILMSYFHIDVTTKEVKIHTRISKDEIEFIQYYNIIKSL